VRARRLWIAVSALTLALGLTACGHKQAHPHNADANNIGGYVDAGPITYQLQLSRILNPYSVEDSQYVKGLPAGTPPLTPDQYWYGVFLWAKNQTGKPAYTSDNFTVVDTQGTVYHPVPLNPNLNAYAWTSQRLYPLQTQPTPDSPASEGPTQGGLLLFRIGASAYANRPLTLHIRGVDDRTQAKISLDL
jgi:hypothetical protein